MNSALIKCHRPIPYSLWLFLTPTVSSSLPLALNHSLWLFLTSSVSLSLTPILPLSFHHSLWLVLTPSLSFILPRPLYLFITTSAPSSLPQPFLTQPTLPYYFWSSLTPRPSLTFSLFFMS